MLKDILEETWPFQELKEEALRQGMQQGIEQGMQQGMQRGELKAKQDDILMIVNARYPMLSRLAEEKCIGIHDLAKLERLMRSIILAPHADEVQRLLLAEEEL